MSNSLIETPEELAPFDRKEDRATILGQNKDGTFNLQHYWFTATGDTIK
jgi:hypothetical protein